MIVLDHIDRYAISLTSAYPENRPVWSLIPDSVVPDGGLNHACPRRKSFKQIAKFRG
jgi:hypothetical protein